jgi:hypothetical protein
MVRPIHMRTSVIHPLKTFFAIVMWMIVLVRVERDGTAIYRMRVIVESVNPDPA